MSDLKVSDRLNRRPSFWKTPITRDASQTIGRKRNYMEMSDNNNNNSNAESQSNPNKKRRLLTKMEIENIAKCGGFNPSNIIIAVEETDGFCWFKRIDKTSSKNIQFDKEKYLEKYWNINSSSNDTKNDGVLRELTKEELEQRVAAKNTINPNQFNKQSAMERAAKLRRHTAPIHVLQKLIDSNDKKEKKEKKKKKKRKKKIKKVIRYETKKEIIRKKVKKKKRIVYKKKTHCFKIRITTEFADIDIPSFPIPDLKLSVLFYSIRNKPYIAIKNFQLSLIESFVMPLTNTYAQHNELSFISRNTLQFLMEIKKNISNIINCIDFEIINDIPIKSSIISYKDNINNNNNNNNNNLSLSISSESSPQKKQDLNENKNRLKTPQIEEDQDLNEEYKFYENQLALIDIFNNEILEEIHFTKHCQEQLKNEEYLTKIFDFDINNDGNIENTESSNVGLDDDEFINCIGSEIDAIYSEYAVNFHEIEYEQKKYSEELRERELNQFELAKYYINNDGNYGSDKEEEDELNGLNGLNELIEIEKKKQIKIRLDSMMNVNEYTKDRMIFSNFIKSNRNNDFREDQNDDNNCNYLRQFDGYQLNENDTLNIMDIDIDK